MPSAHPIPSIASLALSLYTSNRRIERLPRVVEVTQWQCAILCDGQIVGVSMIGNLSYEEI